MSEQSDEHLMIAYGAGSQAAFESLYARHKGGVFRYFLRFTGHKETAEELFQDVWIRLVNARGDYAQSAKFTTYLYRIAHNRLIDHYRHMGSAQYKLRVDSQWDENEDFEQVESDPARILLNEQQNHTLKSAITCLPPEQRDALLMQLEGWLTLEDIAEITNTTRETVKSRLRYAMQKLKDMLGGESDE